MGPASSDSNRAPLGARWLLQKREMLELGNARRVRIQSRLGDRPARGGAGGQEHTITGLRGVARNGGGGDDDDDDIDDLAVRSEAHRKCLRGTRAACLRSESRARYARTVRTGSRAEHMKRPNAGAPLLVYDALSTINTLRFSI